MGGIRAGMDGGLGGRKRAFQAMGTERLSPEVGKGKPVSCLRSEMLSFIFVLQYLSQKFSK